MSRPGEGSAVSRPPVSVVMPFAGDSVAARDAIASLLLLDVAPGDELILADNTALVAPSGGVHVVPVAGERSPAHARNAGAEQAHCDWILFIDADCRVSPDLLDAFFASPVSDDVGALAGEVVPSLDGQTVAERYGATRSFLSQQVHLAHPYMPRAVAANLLVRRAAFEQVGGFFEGVRAAEDTDFSWRLQRAGWQLELRPSAVVEHRYRASLGELRAQWRGYAAGRAWLRRRYEGFEPEPALRRGVARGWARVRGGAAASPRAASRTRSTGRAVVAPRPQRAQYFALDALLAVDELAGFALSNRPRAVAGPGSPGSTGRASDAGVVLVADRFPVPGDPLVDFARTLGGARVEAGGRPDAPWLAVSRELDIRYREDEGLAARLLALMALVVRHPIRALSDVFSHRSGEPSLAALAPAAVRLERASGARVHPLGGEEVRAVARRLAVLAGRAVDERR